MTTINIRPLIKVLLYVVFMPIISLYAQTGNESIKLYENKTLKVEYSLLDDELERKYIDVNSNVLGKSTTAYKKTLLIPDNDEIVSYEVERVEEYLEGIISVIGYNHDSQSSLVATFSNDNANIRIRSHDGSIHKQTRYDRDVKSYYVATLKRDLSLPGCGNDDLNHSNHDHGNQFVKQDAQIITPKIAEKYQSQRAKKVEIPASEVTTVDMMYAYTDSAQAYAEAYNREGINTIEEYLAQTTALTQFVFDNSRIPVELRVVSLFNLEYDEYNEPDSVSSYDWFYRLRDKDDGYMDDVHIERDNVGADLVAGIFSNLSKAEFCGVANYASNLEGGSDQYAFSANLIQCSLYNQTVAHEIGHNFGVAHSRTQDSNAASIVGRQFPYSVGYQFVSTNYAFNTIMAYGQYMETLSGNTVYTTDIEAFSAPELYLTAADGNDYYFGTLAPDAPVNARLNNLLSKDVIASFRPSRTEPPVLSTVNDLSVDVTSGTSTTVSIPIQNIGSSRLMWNLRHKEDSETNIYRTDSEESLIENFEVGFPLNSEEYLRNGWRTGSPGYYPPMSVMTYPDLLSESQSKKMTVSVTSQDQRGLLKSPFLGYEESMITTVEMDLRFKPTSDFYIEIEPIGDENGYNYISFNENGMYLWSENNDGVFEYEYENITYSDLFHHKIKMVLNNQEGTFNFLIDDLPFLSLSVPEKKLATRVSYLEYYVNKNSGEQLQLSIDNVRVTRTKVNDFIDLDSVSGSIAAGRQTSPTFTVDATNLSPGSYEVMLELLSNDINSPVTEIPLQINVSSNSNTEDFQLASNGVTITCDNANIDESGVVGGVTYTKRTADQITADNAATSCTSGITDMSELFSDISNFNEDISHWDVSSVTSMRFMFDSTPFNQDIGMWDVSSVTDMYGMFIFSEFNQPIGNWDVSSVTDMDGLFYNTPFNQDIGDWDVSSVTNMDDMFQSSEFNRPIGNWDVSSVTNMNEMFMYTPFNQPIGSWDVSSVTNMGEMFASSDFNQDISNWCVPLISSEPLNFSINSPLLTKNKPEWGTCPGIPTTPTPLTPQDDTTGVTLTPTLSWNQDIQADSYALQVSADGFESFVVNESLSDTSFTTPELDYNTEYSWRVRGTNSSGDGDWSEVWNFTTFSKLQTPTLLNPRDGQLDVGTVTDFDWSDVGSALGYNLEVSTASDMSTIAFKSDTISTSDYIMTESLTQNQLHYWRVKALSNDPIQSSEWSKIQSFGTGVRTNTEYDVIPTDYSLNQNYPNPFNPTTTITYSLPQSGIVTINVYDITGRFITTLVDGVKGVGTHTVQFEGGSLSSGMYVYTLETDGYRQTRQMMLVK